MSSALQKKICSKHNLEINTIDLSKSVMNENKYLCTKCLIGKIYSNNMVLVNQTEEMIKEIEKTQKTMKNQEIQQRVENYKLIQQQLIKCQEQFLRVIEKIKINLEDKIQSTNEELQQYQSQQNEQKIEDQIEILSKNYKGNNIYKIPLQFKNIEKENQFFNDIKQQLLSFNNNQSYIQLLNSLSQTIIDEKIKDEAASKILSIQKFDNDQTPSLNIKCNKHGKQIILLNLDPNQTSHSRKVCIECVCENDPIKYTSLNEADKRWREYQEQTQNLIQEQIKNRKFKQQQILKILEDIRDKYTSFLNEQINKIKDQQFQINKLDIDNIMENLIYDLAEDQIDEIVRTLSQNDLFQVLLNNKITIKHKIKYFIKILLRISINIFNMIYRHLKLYLIFPNLIPHKNSHIANNQILIYKLKFILKIRKKIYLLMRIYVNLMNILPNSESTLLN